LTRSFSPFRSELHFSNGITVAVGHNGAVEIDWADVINEVDKSWLLSGWVQVLLSLYRGKLPFHASCVSVEDRTVAIAGNSGAGKSTTAYSLLKQGHRLLVDDVSILTLTTGASGPRRVLLEPFNRPINLMRDSLALLNVEGDTWKPMGSFPIKGSVNIPEISEVPVPLDTVVIIEPDREEAHISTRELRGKDAFQALYPIAARSGACEAILGRDQFLDYVTAIVKDVRVLKLRRNPSSNTLSSVVSEIEKVAS
jgi:hypothetical protein